MREESKTPVQLFQSFYPGSRAIRKDEGREHSRGFIMFSPVILLHGLLFLTITTRRSHTKEYPREQHSPNHALTPPTDSKEEAMNTRYIHTNHSAFLLTSGHDIHPAPERIPNQQRKTILPSLVILVGIIFVTSLLIFSGYASAWSDDSTVNTPICTAASDQECPQIINDGSGGAIITWADYRSGSTGTKRDIYAQRVDASGTPQWTTDGVAICTESGDQNHPAITSDGSGGAIITWADYRSGTNWDIYAQRVDASGSVQWTSDVPICTAGNYQGEATLTSDGSGGAIITWVDSRTGTNNDIYAQRVDATGNIPSSWTTDGTDGVPICTADDDQEFPQIINDGSGGAIITWDDCRGGITNSDIYAQLVNASGVPQWNANGVAICTADYDQRDLQITTDGSGGAIITWSDYRSSTDTDYDIYAQQIYKSGKLSKDFPWILFYPAILKKQ